MDIKFIPVNAQSKNKQKLANNTFQTAKLMAVGQYKDQSHATPSSFLSIDQTSGTESKKQISPRKVGNDRYGIQDDIRFEPDMDYSNYFSIISELGEKGGFYD